MKRFICVFIVVTLFGFSGCGIKKDTQSVLFFDGGRSFAHVIHDDISNDIRGCEFLFYNSRGNNFVGKAMDISRMEREIDDFTEVKADVLTQSTERSVGLSVNSNPFPREIDYGFNSISADFDGTGTKDEVRWNFTVSDNKTYGEMWDYTLTVVLNGEEHSFSNHPDTPTTADEISVFVIDINGDGVFEIILYEKLAHIISSVTVFDTKGGNLSEMFCYVINPGP